MYYWLSSISITSLFFYVLVRLNVNITLELIGIGVVSGPVITTFIFAYFSKNYLKRKFKDKAYPTFDEVSK